MKGVLARGEAPQTGAAPQPATAPSAGPLVLAVPGEFMGRGEHDELGQALMRNFFYTLGEVETLPDTVIFFNSGVKLVAEGSPVLEGLQALAERGVSILICRTCLEHYDLEDKVAVGEISNMYDIAEAMLNAGKVVTL